MQGEIIRPTYLEQQSQITTPVQERLRPFMAELRKSVTPEERRAVVAQYFRLPSQDISCDVSATDSLEA